MKLIKSTIKRDIPIGELPNGKVLITMNGRDPENIWVAIDNENNVMYLLNHAVMFFPIPTWGVELPLARAIDLALYRGNNSNETQFTVCEEAYDSYKDFLNEKEEFDVELYINS